jgi:hypothetical protein
VPEIAVIVVTVMFVGSKTTRSFKKPAVAVQKPLQKSKRAIWVELEGGCEVAGKIKCHHKLHHLVRLDVTMP